MWNLPAVLAVQQPLVCVDLTLQPGLGVQQHLILLVLPLQVAADLSQLVLHVIDQTLYLGQLRAVLGLSLCHGAFQRFCLQKERECKECGCRTISGARLPVFQPCSTLYLSSYVTLENFLASLSLSFCFLFFFFSVWALFI